MSTAQLDGQLSLLDLLTPDVDEPTAEVDETAPRWSRFIAPRWPGDIHAGLEWSIRMPHRHLPIAGGRVLRVLDLCGWVTRAGWPREADMSSLLDDGDFTWWASCRCCRQPEPPFTRRLNHGHSRRAKATGRPICTGMDLTLSHVHAHLKELAAGIAPEQRTRVKDWESTLAERVRIVRLRWGATADHLTDLHTEIEALATRTGITLTDWLPDWGADHQTTEEQS